MNLGRASFAEFQQMRKRLPGLLAPFCVSLLLLAQWAAPTYAQWSNVQYSRLATSLECIGSLAGKCLLYEGDFYAYSGEQVIVHFDPPHNSWWNTWDIEVYIHGGGVRFDEWLASLFGAERHYAFTVFETREYAYSIVLKDSRARPSGTAYVTLEINTRNPGDRGSAEPTAKPAPRYTLVSGERVSGKLNDKNSADHYEFYAYAGDTVTIAMNAGGSDGLDPYLELLDRYGGEVAVDDDGGSGLNARLDNVRIEEEGAYTIRARRYDSSTAGAYTLSLHIESRRSKSYDGIHVAFGCDLASAIESANRDRSVGNCERGRGADTIILQQNIVLNSELPRIQSDITIEGNGYAISGNGRHRLFVIDRGAALTIRNAVLTDGYAADDGALNLVGDGGAILNEGELRLENSEMRRNRAGEDGGAIRNLSEATIVDSEFYDNSAARQGGAIYSSDGSEDNDSASLTVIRSQFISNRTSERHAGALFIGGDARIEDSKFNNNHAHISGGAIYNLGDAVISRGEFHGNQSQKNGGAIFNDYKANITVADSEFNSNATRDGGGALMSYARASARVYNSEFRNNSASRGALMVKGLSRSGQTFYGALYLRGNYFSGNSGGDCVIGDYGEIREDRDNRYSDGGCRYR